MYQRNVTERACADVMLQTHMCEVMLQKAYVRSKVTAPSCADVTSQNIAYATFLQLKLEQ